MGTVNFNFNSDIAQTITTVNNTIQNLTNQFIVTPNGYPPGVNGFVFDVVDDETIELDADITDSWIETNSTIQDHIALKPVKFTLKGFVGELYDIFQVQGANDTYTPVLNLLNIPGLLPIWNNQDAQFYTTLTNQIAQAQSVVSGIQSFASLVSGFSPSLSRQQQAYTTFYGLWMNRTLCSVQTPFTLLTSMAIESVHVIQSGKSNLVSDFTVTFKQIQQISTIAITPAVGNPNPKGSATNGISPNVAYPAQNTFNNSSSYTLSK